MLSWTFKTRNYEITLKYCKKVTQDKNGKNIPQSEITEVVLVHGNLVNNINRHDSRILKAFLPIDHFDNFYLSPTSSIF